MRLAGPARLTGLPRALRFAPIDVYFHADGWLGSSRRAAGSRRRGGWGCRGGRFLLAGAVGGVGGPGRTVFACIRCCFLHFMLCTFYALASARTACTAQATARVCVRGRVSCLHECVVNSVRHSLRARIASHIIYSQRAEGRREALRGALSPSLHGRTKSKCDGVRVRKVVSAGT